MKLRTPKILHVIRTVIVLILTRILGDITAPALRDMRAIHISKQAAKVSSSGFYAIVQNLSVLKSEKLTFITSIPKFQSEMNA